MRFTCFIGSLQVKAFSQSLESFRTAIVVGGTNIADQVIDTVFVFCLEGSFHVLQLATCLLLYPFKIII